MSKDKKKGFLQDLFGGLTGKAEKGIRKRPSRLEQAEQEAVKGKKKKKTKNRKGKKGRNTATYR